jgi:hypothetical protein
MVMNSPAFSDAFAHLQNCTARAIDLMERHGISAQVARELLREIADAESDLREVFTIDGQRAAFRASLDT